MADYKLQQLGGTDNSLINSITGLQTGLRKIPFTIDIGKAVEDGYVKTESFFIMTLPAGSILHGFDAVITETLSLGTSGTTDIGHTKADPDEYVDAQSDTAVGAFTAYVAATFPERIGASDKVLYAEFNNSGGAVADGVIQGYVLIMPPISEQQIAPARPRVYPNS